MRLRSLLIASVCLALSATALGQGKSLKVGDTAPGLDIEKWVKGEETGIESGKAYVVEFWATWCAPCRRSIPHLTSLQREYGDQGLTIIGISTEDVEMVEPFVRGQGDKMGYTVAVDRRSSTNRAWFKAAGLKGIPAAFVVDTKGKIAFIGNPLADQEQMDSVIAKVVSGRYDPVLERQAEPILKAARNARNVRNWRMATRHYNEVIALDPQVFVDVALEQFEMMLVNMDNEDEAYAYVQELQATFAEDPGALQMMARKIATDPRIPNDKRDLDVALESAQAGLQSAGRNDPDALATLALIHYVREDLDQAIEYQKRAYFQASSRAKPEFKRVLNTYQQAQTRASLR